jgi:hypothetical protein
MRTRITEKDLSRIVRRVISEQDEDEGTKSTIMKSSENDEIRILCLPNTVVKIDYNGKKTMKGSSEWLDFFCKK